MRDIANTNGHIDAPKWSQQQAETLPFIFTDAGILREPVQLTSCPGVWALW